MKRKYVIYLKDGSEVTLEADRAETGDIGSAFYLREKPVGVFVDYVGWKILPEEEEK